jgi:hypothetical protein
MYMDKLDGRINQEILGGETERPVTQAPVIERAMHVPADQAIDLIRLTSRASEQRRLLQTVVKKRPWQKGSLQTALFEPFEILRHSNQESGRRGLSKRLPQHLASWD